MLAMLALVASVLAVDPSDPIPPNTPLPPALEACIGQAEECVKGACSEVTVQACVSHYETCSYDIPEAHEPSCRVEYVWCVLELGDASPDWYAKRCAVVFETCPS